MNIMIIGGSSGIGRELTLLYAQEGHQVICSGRRRDLLQDISSLFPHNIQPLVMDITDTRGSLHTLTDAIHAQNKLDMVILTAGTGELNNGLNFTLEQSAINTNVTGFTCIADWAYHLFSEQGNGLFACITSIAGLRGDRASPAYNASKAYQINYLEGLRKKAKAEKHHVAICDIRPGFVNTDMMKGEGFFWVAAPQKAAIQIKKALERQKSICYITKRWRLAAWILRCLPSSLYERL